MKYMSIFPRAVAETLPVKKPRGYWLDKTHHRELFEDIAWQYNI